MRNLKRALCFALAAVMVLGLMITGAGAASTYDNFTDKDEIVHQEAVNTMVSLGVINGKEDGSYFAPNDTVTRAEMAKIVAVALNGGKDPVFSENDKTTFSDTQGHWAEKYIAYCVRQGIVAGRGDNSFGPEDPLTGSACAKMFLCALGYRADLEGFVNVGSDWELNVNVKANQDARLYNGLSDIKASDELTRDSVAQMLYNAVQANEVTYGNLYGDYAGVLQAQKGDTMLWNRFKVRKVTGILLANDKLSVADGTSHVSGDVTKCDYGAVALEGRSLIDVTGVSGYDLDSTGGNNNNYNYRTNLLGGHQYKVATTDEMVGQEVVIYVQFQDYLSPNSNNAVVIGEAILTDNNTVVETTGRLKSEAAVRDALRAGGMANIGSPVPFLYSEVAVQEGVKTGVTDTITSKFGTVNDSSRSAGIFQRFIDNSGDGLPDYIVQILPVLTSVNAVSEKDETYTFTGISSAIPFADVVSEKEDLARNDVLLITQYADNKFYVSEPETVEGKVNSYNTNNNNVSVDGENYANSGGRKLNVSGVIHPLEETMVDGSYVFYLDPYGNVLGYYETEAVVGNYCVVTGYTVSGNNNMGYTAKARVIMQDGTTGTFDVNMSSTAVRFGVATNSMSALNKERALCEYSGRSAVNGDSYFGDDNYTPPTPPATPAPTDPLEATGSNLVNHLFSYELDGNTITLARPQHVSTKYYSNNINGITLNNTDLSDSAVSKDNATYHTGTATMTANDQTVFFILDENGDYHVVTGLSGLPATATAISDTNGDGTGVLRKDTISYRATANSTRFLRAAFITVEDAFKSARDFVFVTDKYVTQNNNGTTTYTFNVVDRNGGESKMTTTNRSIGGGDSINAIKNTVREFTRESGYVVFEEPVYKNDSTFNGYTYDGTEFDGVYVKSIDGNTVSLYDVKTNQPLSALILPGVSPRTAPTSFRVESNADIWDVTGDTPARDTMAENDVVAVKIKLDSNGNGSIEAAFIYDTINGSFTDAPDPDSVTVGGTKPNGTLTTPKDVDVTVSATVNTADITVTDMAVSYNGGAFTSVKGLNHGADASRNVWTGTYHIPNTAADDEVLKVRLTVSQNGRDSLTKTYGDYTLKIGASGGGQTGNAITKGDSAAANNVIGTVTEDTKVITLKNRTDGNSDMTVATLKATLKGAARVCSANGLGVLTDLDDADTIVSSGGDGSSSFNIGDVRVLNDAGTEYTLAYANPDALAFVEANTSSSDKGSGTANQTFDFTLATAPDTKKFASGAGNSDIMVYTDEACTVGNKLTAAAVWANNKLTVDLGTALDGTATATAVKKVYVRIETNSRNSEPVELTCLYKPDAPTVASGDNTVSTTGGGKTATVNLNNGTAPANCNIKVYTDSAGTTEATGVSATIATKAVTLTLTDAMKTGDAARKYYIAIENKDSHVVSGTLEVTVNFGA